MNDNSIIVFVFLFFIFYIIFCFFSIEQAKKNLLKKIKPKPVVVRNGKFSSCFYKKIESIKKYEAQNHELLLENINKKKSNKILKMHSHSIRGSFVEVSLENLLNDYFQRFIYSQIKNNHLPYLPISNSSIFIIANQTSTLNQEKKEDFWSSKYPYLIDSSYGKLSAVPGFAYLKLSGWHRIDNLIEFGQLKIHKSPWQNQAFFIKHNFFNVKSFNYFRNEKTQ